MRVDVVHAYRCRSVLLSFALVANVSACRFQRDGVLPGSYGPDQAGNGSIAAAQNMMTPNVPVAGASATAGSSAAGSTAPMSSAGSSAAGGAAGTMAAPNTPAMMPSQPTAANPALSPDGGMAPLDPPVKADPCSLSGRWISTVHYVTDALGQQQSCHSYVYYEIEQTAEAFTIKKGLLCGDDAIGGGDFAATVDFSGSWTAVASRVQYAGRTGTSAATSGGCQVTFQKWYTVRGATLPFYTDPSKPLPSAEQPAMGSTPGWEDWDMDGNPGLTGLISGVVTGKIFVAPRQWTSMTGSVPDVSSAFKLPLLWDQEPNVMAYDGSPLLASSAARAADAALHFVQFARLTAEQAAGDDKAICASVTKLAKTLTPEAAAM
jgi:hypothetical protein